MRLSPRQEQIVELVCVHGMSYPEVAEELGIATGTVRVYIDRIRTTNGLDMSPRKALYHVFRAVREDTEPV